MAGRLFSFTENGDGVRVTSHDLYEEQKGYGFLDCSTTSASADRFTGTGGWNLREETEGKQDFPASLYDTEDGAELLGAGIPLRFRASVPENGTYAVTVIIRGGRDGISGLMLYSGRRNLVKRDLEIMPGEEFTVTYYVQVCPYIPIVGKGPKEDRSIYVTVLNRAGGRARLTGVHIEPAECPVLYIAGDSLVTDYEGLYPYNPIRNFGSWGQNLLQYFNRIAVSDQAHGGLTTNCFRDDGHWNIISENIKPGDIFMMEFGHNDQKRRNLKAFDQYASNLRWYILQIRRKGAFPVIVTSLSRVPGKDENGFFDLLEDYAESCRRVGKELKVPVIDLHSYSFRLWCDMGPDTYPDYFMDTTHTNDYGALLAAKFINEEIRRLEIEPLCTGMNDYAGEAWEPDVSLYPKEEMPGEHSSRLAELKEERPVLPTDLPELPYADCSGIPQEQDLKKAMAGGLLDPCILFFHPFDEMPRGQFLYMFFKAVKVPAGRSYQGRYCDIYKYEFDAGNVQAAWDVGLIDEKTTPDDRFRPDDGLTCGELVSFMVRSLQPEAERNMEIEACEEMAAGLGLLWDGYCRESKANRADCTAALVRLMGC
ncbi:rhamnogalacturonan acetylesterase [Eisenbergiella tayi]|uniref:Rhamnogalacturonan acetylesterase RhgT n=1 Tax=Eisenbergiella tayi TaxID=1432052 RepID=A0A1E3A1Z0_9FIRM|nr:rhamnogalacturonan acetylesterase [Eisenbergiella tayi]ODM02517.1 Rhamnogalacturonan acetylesterase RhgT [Eisenbergiella tayi]